jgi:oligo-1,6-glucosidase
MKEIAFSSREDGRTPMQWDDTENPGFTAGIPWFKVNPNCSSLNAALQETDANSCLNYFRKMVKLRKDNLALVYGKYSLLDKDNPDVYVYTRELNGKKFLVILNIKSKTSTVNTGINLSIAKVLLNNYGSSKLNETLQPYEATVN